MQGRRTRSTGVGAADTAADSAADSAAGVWSVPLCTRCPLTAGPAAPPPTLLSSLPPPSAPSSFGAGCEAVDGAIGSVCVIARRGGALCAIARVEGIDSIL